VPWGEATGHATAHATGGWSCRLSQMPKKIEREFRACWPLFLGVSILIPGVLVPGAVVPGAASQGVASSGHCWSWSLLVVGPRGFRLTRLLRVVASELWLAGCFNLKGVLWEGLSGRVRIYF
jgi:hypothetical protein